MKNLAVILIIMIFSVGFSAEVVCKPTPSSIKFAGTPNSPIEVTMFISASCPPCKQAAVMFYEMANSVYKGKMKVSIKPLYKQLGDIALIAANNQNKSWELIRAYSNISRRIDAENMIDLFNEAGIDLDKINKDMQDSTKIFKILEANYAESQKCGLNFTPHIIINGVSFNEEITPQRVMDYINKLLRNKEK